MSDNVRNEPTLQHLPGAEDAAHREAELDQQPTRRLLRKSRRRHAVYWVLGLIAVLAIAALISVFWQPGRRVESPVVVPPSPPRAAADAPQPPRYPIEPVAAALPPLDASDEAMLALLQSLWPPGSGIGGYLQQGDVIRNFVTTVDNIPRKAIAPQRVPLKPPAGTFGTDRGNDAVVLGAANAIRYRPYVALMQNADMTRLVQAYVRHYPLFQQAYRELGYPNGHFNDRLVEAIDVLLAAPEQRAPLKLVQPKIFYEFADRDLERLPAGQKLMLRMGPDNAKAVKGKLTELRALVTAQVETPR